jgi:hypothetical protein
MASVIEKHFVIANGDSWRDLLEVEARGYLPPAPREIAGRIKNNEDCWVILTYVHLRRRGLPVRLQTRFVPDAICVASGLDYGIRTRPDQSFVIACRGDGPRVALCDFQVVQNPCNVWSQNDFLIPLWPQPDLLPRDPGRETLLRNVVYKGDLGNLNEPFRRPEFRAALEKRGLRLSLDGKPEGNGLVSWGDYREADLLLAVRNLTRGDAKLKPASKLLNAWHAGVPALLGPEPAFQRLRRSEFDYLEIRTPEDALAAIDRLLAEPQRYRAMVEQAARRSPEFGEDATARLWIELLEAAERGLARWRRRPGPLRSLRFVGQALGQKIFDRYADYHRNHGRRILDG